jgi:hypothetical protein
VTAQEFEPTLYSLAPSADKLRARLAVQEVRTEAPHVHLQAVDGVEAGHVLSLAVSMRERADVVRARRRETEARLEQSCLLCHGAQAGPGHACGAWVRVQVHEPAAQVLGAHTESAARVHEQLAYAELSGIATAGAGALPELRLLLCVAGEQEVLAGMLNAVALAACLRTPETVVPGFCVPPEGASLLSLHACVEHYAAALGLDAGARAALHLHSTRVALNEQAALEVAGPRGEVLACWRALLRHRLWQVPCGAPGVASPSHVLRALRQATGHAIQRGDLVRMLDAPEHAHPLPAWPEAVFARLREIFAHEFGVWSREARAAPRLHDAFASAGQRQRRELLFLQYLLRTLGPPAVDRQGRRCVPVAGGVQAQ